MRETRIAIITLDNKLPERPAERWSDSWTSLPQEKTLSVICIRTEIYFKIKTFEHMKQVFNNSIDFDSLNKLLTLLYH